MKRKTSNVPTSSVLADCYRCPFLPPFPTNLNPNFPPPVFFNTSTDEQSRQLIVPVHKKPPVGVLLNKCDTVFALQFKTRRENVKKDYNNSFIMANIKDQRANVVVFDAGRWASPTLSSPAVKMSDSPDLPSQGREESQHNAGVSEDYVIPPGASLGPTSTFRSRNT